MLSQLFVGAIAFLALFSTASTQSCNPGQPYGPLADGSCDPYVPPVNLANPTPADHTTGVQFSDYQLSSLNSITNFVFLVLSEDSFDNLMATFPGVNNLQTLINSNSYPAQVNWSTGVPYSSFPADPTNKIPAGLPNAPYNIVSQSNIPGVSLSTVFSNPSHNFHQTQLKINGGAENGWIYWSTGKSATMGMGYYDLSATPNSGIWGVGQKYTVFDRFHVGSFGDQVCAHMYTVGAATPPYDSTNPGKCPSSILNQTQWFAPTVYNGSMWLLSDPTTQPALSRDCYLIGDVVSNQICDIGGDLVFPQIPNSVSNPKHFGDLADGAGVSWAYYSENFTLSESTNCSAKDGWNRHESALTHFSTFNFVNNTYWQTHQKDSTAFFPALTQGTLEQVTWYRPSQNEDYGFSNNDPAAGNAFIDSFFSQIYASSLWQQNKLAVFVTFSDANGMFDHVPPYVGDRFGPGVRVPAFMVSPFHQRSLGGNSSVNSQPYEHYSWFKMLARRFGISQSALQSVWGNTRYTAALDLTTSFPLAAAGQQPTYSGVTGSSTSSSTGASASGGGGNNGNAAGSRAVVGVVSVLMVVASAMLLVL